MGSPIDETTLSTLSLLESRLLRIEHVIHGHDSPPAPASGEDSALQRMADLERRFGLITSRIRVYGELMKIYHANPDFFHAPKPSEIPSQLAPDAIRSIVLASAPSFSTTLSALTAIQDSPIPDPAESASLITLSDRMKAIEATQLAQAAEMAELRSRSEVALRAWFEGDMLPKSDFMADVEDRFEQVERAVKRRENEIQRAKAI